MGCFGGGGLTNEKAYQLGKFARALERSYDFVRWIRLPWQEHRQPVTAGQFRAALPLVELPKVPVR